MADKSEWLTRAATTAVPNPGEFPVGSELSRAAARAMLTAKLAADRQSGDLPLKIRLGKRRMLPSDYTGERHTVAVPLPESGFYVFEERPGLAPAEAMDEPGYHYLDVEFVPPPPPEYWEGLAEQQQA